MKAILSGKSKYWKMNVVNEKNRGEISQVFLRCGSSAKWRQRKNAKSLSLLNQAHLKHREEATQLANKTIN